MNSPFRPRVILKFIIIVALHMKLLGNDWEFRIVMLCFDFGIYLILLCVDISYVLKFYPNFYYQGSSRDYLKDISLNRPKMREPKVKDSLSWGKRKSQNVSTEDAGLISEAVSSLNKFSNDGSFMREVLRKQSNKSDGPARENLESEIETSSAVKDSSLSANQLAAKALQLNMKGKHEEAEKLLVRPILWFSLLILFIIFLIYTMCTSYHFNAHAYGGLGRSNHMKKELLLLSDWHDLWHFRCRLFIYLFICLCLLARSGEYQG